MEKMDRIDRTDSRPRVSRVFEPAVTNVTLGARVPLPVSAQGQLDRLQGPLDAASRLVWLMPGAGTETRIADTQTQSS